MRLRSSRRSHLRPHGGTRDPRPYARLAHRPGERPRHTRRAARRSGAGAEGSRAPLLRPRRAPHLGPGVRHAVPAPRGDGDDRARVDPTGLPEPRVGSELTSELSTVEHLVPMLSLANSYNLADLREWEQSVRRYLNLGDGDAGLGLRHRAEVRRRLGGARVRRRLPRARGDARQWRRGRGHHCQYADAAVGAAQSCFSTLGMARVELRGEALIRKDRFAAINAAREADNRAAREERGEDAPQQSLFANPRNAARELWDEGPAETAQAAARRIRLLARVRRRCAMATTASRRSGVTSRA